MPPRIVQDYKFFRNMLVFIDYLFKVVVLLLLYIFSYLFCLWVKLDVLFAFVPIGLVIMIKAISVLMRIRLNTARGKNIKYSIQDIEGKRVIYDSNNQNLADIKLGRITLEEFHQMLLTSLKHMKLGLPYIVFINNSPKPATVLASKYRGVFLLDFYSELFTTLTKKELYTVIMHKLAHRKYSYSLRNIFWFFSQGKKKTYSNKDELFCDYVSSNSTSPVSAINALIKSASRYYIYDNVTDKLKHIRKRQNIDITDYAHLIVKEIPFSVPLSSEKAVKLDQHINSVIENYGIKYGKNLKGLVPVNRAKFSIETSHVPVTGYDWMKDDFRPLKRSDIIELYNAISSHKRNSLFNIRFFNTVLTGSKKQYEFFPTIEERIKNIVNNFLS